MDKIQGFFDHVIKSMPKSLPQLAHKVAFVELFPYFMLVHYTLVILALRARPGAREFARDHPVSSLCVGVTSCFGGGIITAALTGKPLLAPFANTNNVLITVLVWYTVMFSPFDFVHSFLQIRGVKAVLLGMKEVQRIRGIKDGVMIANNLYNGNAIVAVILGCVKGSGAKFIMRPLDQFMRGEAMTGYEITKPAFSTKTAILSSILLLTHKAGLFGGMKEPMLILGIIIFAVTFSVGSLFVDMQDPYKVFEDLIHFLAMRAPEEIVKKDNKSKKD